MQTQRSTNNMTLEMFNFLEIADSQLLSQNINNSYVILNNKKVSVASCDQENMTWRESAEREGKNSKLSLP